MSRSSSAGLAIVADRPGGKGMKTAPGLYWWAEGPCLSLQRQGIRVEVNGQVLSQGGDVAADQVTDTTAYESTREFH